MKRYTVLDAPLEILLDADGEMVFFEDVADLERRYREAMELLRGIRDDIKCQANNRGGIVDRIDYALADEQEGK